MSKVVISGYYGFNNVGDESILTAIISNMKDKVGDVEVTVLSASPKLTEEKHNVKSIDRKKLTQIIKEIKNCDLLISGGGSLLQDVTSNRSIVYYLAIISIGILFKKKVMIYSQGIGPINRKFNKIITKLILEKVNYITLRDFESKQFLLDMKIKNKNIIISADPVIGLKPADISTGKNILHEYGIEDMTKPLLGFAIRGRDVSKNNIKIFSKIADRAMEELGVNIVFIPFHLGEDVKVMDKIRGNMKNEAIYLKDKYDLNIMLSIVGNLDLLIGIRLHSLIFAAVMNTPMIAISYDPKINNFMEYLGEDVFCNVEKLDENELYSEIKEIINHEDKYKEKLYTEVKSLKDRLKNNEEIIEKLLLDKSKG